jgi:hypothetical protein
VSPKASSFFSAFLVLPSTTSNPSLDHLARITPFRPLPHRVNLRLRDRRGSTNKRGAIAIRNTHASLYLPSRNFSSLPSRFHGESISRLSTLDSQSSSLSFHPRRTAPAMPSKRKLVSEANTEPASVPSTLPPSVEEAYRRKCVQLKNRTTEVEEANDAARLRLARIKRQVEKLRIERAFLLEQLAKRTSTNVEDSEGSPSPPPTVCLLATLFQSFSASSFLVSTLRHPPWPVAIFLLLLFLFNHRARCCCSPFAPLSLPPNFFQC